MDSLAGLAIATIVVVSASGLIGDTQATPGQLMSFVTALLMAYEPAKRLSRMRVTIEAHVVGVQLLFDLMDRQETLVEAEGAVDLTGGPGEIALRGLEFHYGDGRQVLRGIDTVFRAGEVTALVGPSGGGKSTILNLLLRLQDPTGGGIEIDGVDLRRARLPSLRGAMSYVGQDTFLFSTSILQNIAYGRRGATREEVEAAARAANAHEFILATEHGYDTLVGENGAFLSGGQRQRIAIARAILRNAPILILDEATSALDAQSEAVVRDALLTAMEGRTTVMVTHRLSALKGVQKVCYLEDGRILEEGAIEDLLARRGKFHALWQEQQLSGEAA
jgi:ATP-binding cassette subfamily B protein